MKTNKKIYWLTFALQLALSTFAFFKIYDRYWSHIIAIYINLIWFLCSLLPFDERQQKRQPLSYQVVIVTTIIILTLKLIGLCYPSSKKLIDFFVLLLFNVYLILDDVIVLFKNKKRP